MNALSMSPQGAGAPLRDKFAEFHANKTRAYVNQTMSNGQNIFDVFQACIILSWWFYSEGRWVEVWVQAGFQTRAVIPLGLNYLGLIKRGADGAPVKNPYLAPPKNFHETETRRRAWWMSIMFDRIVSVGGWLHSVDERDIGTELPLTAANYDAGVRVVIFVRDLHMLTRVFLLDRLKCFRIPKHCIQKMCTPFTPSTTPTPSFSSLKALCFSGELQTIASEWEFVPRYYNMVAVGDWMRLLHNTVPTACLLVPTPTLSIQPHRATARTTLGMHRDFALSIVLLPSTLSIVSHLRSVRAWASAMLAMEATLIRIFIWPIWFLMRTRVLISRKSVWLITGLSYFLAPLLRCIALGLTTPSLPHVRLWHDVWRLLGPSWTSTMSCDRPLSTLHFCILL